MGLLREEDGEADAAEGVESACGGRRCAGVLHLCRDRVWR